jgi:hypothetical protein
MMGSKGEAPEMLVRASAWSEGRGMPAG